MWRNAITTLIVGVLLGLAGCGNSSTPSSTSAEGIDQQGATEGGGPTADTPHGAVTLFLSAVCAGNDEQAARMLTDLARRKTTEMDLEVAPAGSDTAQFQVGAVEYLGEDAARVACVWSDLDEAGGRAEEPIVWALRREAAGWRIAGMAPTIFPDEPPLLLNFEDPEEMLEKLQWVREETMRRAQAEMMQSQPELPLEAQRQGDAETPMR